MKIMMYCKWNITWNFKPGQEPYNNFKNDYYKSHLKKLKYLNDLCKFLIPGVDPHTQTELFTNWCKHIPMEHQDVTCTMPPK